MTKRKLLKRILIVSVAVLVLLFGTILTAFGILEHKTNKMLDSVSDLYAEPKYQQAILLDNIEVIEQNVSCGYAVIEMFSDWAEKDITEEKLYNEYGKVVTSTGKTFCEEMNKQFPEYTTTMYKYLTNTELIDKVYDSLIDGMPVPFEWAAQYQGEWTLHYSLVIGMDIPNNKITVANPYGYIEELALNEFLERTSFEAYEDMPFYFEIAFAFGIFEKNTIFVVQ